MKTLKKVLCLVLALVMVVGTMAISAAAFEDDDKINEDYAKAVAVLNGAAIIDGYADGNFGATDTLTRAQGVAIVVRAVLGREVADKLNASAVPFSDVEGNNAWAKGVVAYAVQKGMANGWDGKFDPTGKLTGYAFAKFWLTAMGVEGTFTGTDWENNVLLAAIENNLLDDLADDYDLSKPITREEAAQMAYTAILSGSATVPTGSWDVIKTVNGAKSTYMTVNSAYEAWAVAEKMNEDAPEGTTYSTAQNKKTVGSLNDSDRLWKSSTSTDAFGVTSDVVKNADGDVIYSKAATPVYTTTTATSRRKIAVELGVDASNKSGAKATVITVYVDGVKGNATTAYRDTFSDSAINGTGDVVEVYYTGKNSDGLKCYNVIVKNLYIKELEATDIKAATKKTATKDAKDAYIVLEPANGNVAALNYNTADFAAGDVVLYNKGMSNGSVVAKNVVKAEAVSGVITAAASNKSYVAIDGTKTLVARVCDEANVAVSAVTRIIYKDANGYVVAIANPTGTAAVDKEYVYVKSIKAVQKASSSNNLFSTDVADYTVQAQIVDLASGEIKVVDVATTLNAAKNAVCYSTVSNGVGAEVEARNATINAYREFALIDGKYAFGNDDIVATAVSLKKGTADIATGIVADSKTSTTVLTAVKTSGVTTGYTVTTYSGIAGYPSTAITGNALVLANDNGVAVKVYIMVEPNTVSTIKYAVFAGEGGDALVNGTTVPTYLFYVDGETAQYVKTDGKNFENAGTVYNIEVNNGKVSWGAATLADSKLNAQVTGTVVAIESTYVRIKDANNVVHTVYFNTNGYTVVDGTDSYSKLEGLNVGDAVAVYGVEVTTVPSNASKGAGFFIVNNVEE